MKVTVITVCYNAAKTIEKSIQSVLEQTYNDLEYIIVDGNSKDQTLQIVSKYNNRISKIVSEPDKGIYDAMNKGIALSSGSLIGLLNADDVYAHPKIIKNLVNQIQLTGADSIYGDLEYIKNDKVFRYWQSGKFSSPNLFKWGWMPPHPTFFVRKEVYSKLGVFNLDFKIAADYELMLRFLYKNQISVTYLPEVVVKMMVGGESNKNLGNRVKANKEDQKAWEINQLKMPFYVPFLKPLRKLYQFRFW
jgi:glycosyltransferase involved in cell wall biosynthesis